MIGVYCQILTLTLFITSLASDPLAAEETIAITFCRLEKLENLGKLPVSGA